MFRVNIDVIQLHRGLYLENVLGSLLKIILKSIWNIFFIDFEKIYPNKKFDCPDNSVNSY